MNKEEALDLAVTALGVRYDQIRDALESAVNNDDDVVRLPGDEDAIPFYEATSMVAQYGAALDVFDEATFHAESALDSAIQRAWSAVLNVYSLRDAGHIVEMSRDVFEDLKEAIEALTEEDK